MNTIEAIYKRKSVRKYTNRKIDEKDINIILKAGMSGPSCVNAKDWYFIVVTDHETLCKMADANGRPAQMLTEAPMAILVCGDVNLAFKGAKDYWIIDASIACQNMILAARELGIGSVWLGTWPQMDRVEKQKGIFSLPDNLIPHSVIAFGYADEDSEKSDEPIIDGNKIRYIR